MNVTQQGIVALMKSAVLRQPQPLPEGFELRAAVPLIRQHHIAALIYDGAERCGMTRREPTMAKLFQAYCSSLLLSEGQEREIGRIFHAFDENGIDYLPLKGCNMKALYPKPEMRTMGDADILIRPDQYSRIAPVMKSLGFAYQYESDHELVWENEALNVELHKHLIPSYNRELYAYFGDGWAMAVPGGGSRWDMTPEDTFVFLFTHFAKHYRDCGIGLRHVLDLWVYLRANPNLDMNRVLSVMEKLKLRQFYGHISRLLAVWFEGAEPDDRTEFISEFIFASGSWGSMEQRVVSESVRNMHRSGTGAGGKLRYFWRLAFPSRESLQEKYPVLRKAPWLLPVIWLVRPVRKLLFERESLGRQKRVMDAMTRENLDERHRMLKYVGLDQIQGL
ncbi:MAG: nucleotidyltransferase family protein [Oscillospiraceae bacterium]|nr:nucleotidyltransferase family protein [Oscillospiraceae bacterium]